MADDPTQAEPAPDDAEAPTTASPWRRFRARPVWTQVAAAAIVLLVVAVALAAALGPTEVDTAGTAFDDTTTTERPTTTERTTTTERSTTTERETTTTEQTTTTTAPTTTTAEPTTTTTTTTSTTTTSTTTPSTTTTTSPPPEVSPPPSDACHPSYDPCVPVASDVDCAGGSGDGPLYTGRVTVVGPDEYDLDRDGDGIGCE